MFIPSASKRKLCEPSSEEAIAKRSRIATPNRLPSPEYDGYDTRREILTFLQNRTIPFSSNYLPSHSPSPAFGEYYPVDNNDPNDQGFDHLSDSTLILNSLELSNSDRDSIDLDSLNDRSNILPFSAQVQPEFHFDPALESTLRDAFYAIFYKKDKYKSLLELQGENAQIVLNALQMILDHHQESFMPLRKDLLQALLRLSKNSSLFPQCFTLKDIKHTGLAVASGHFGEVWKGDFRGSNVCLKVVKAYQNSHIEKLLKAYAKEAILWSQLSHPNLLPFYGIYHLGDEYRRICLVSPWMDNGNVNEYLQQFPRTNRLILLNDIAQGISYLHGQNIVHGDLKGANILVSSSGRACLGDFGLSFLSDPEVIKWTSLQSTANAGGTVRWQAPELVDPEAETIHVSKESDIYAFACVCYEVFTGEVPFYEILRDATVTLRISRGETPSRPNLESHDPDSVFSRGLTEVIWGSMKDCWKWQPAERPSIEEVLLRFPRDGTDLRPEQDWNQLTSAQFRKTMQSISSSNQFSNHYIAQVIKLLAEL